MWSKARKNTDTKSTKLTVWWNRSKEYTQKTYIKCRITITRRLVSWGRRWLSAVMCFQLWARFSRHRALRLQMQRRLSVLKPTSRYSLSTTKVTIVSFKKRRSLSMGIRPQASKRKSRYHQGWAHHTRASLLCWPRQPSLLTTTSSNPKIGKLFPLLKSKSRTDNLSSRALKVCCRSPNP